MLIVRRVLREQTVILHRRLLAIVRDDEVCRRLMTVPGVGPVVPLTYRATVDVPARFRRSKSVGAVFGQCERQRYPASSSPPTLRHRPRSVGPARLAQEAEGSGNLIKTAEWILERPPQLAVFMFLGVGASSTAFVCVTSLDQYQFILPPFLHLRAISI